MTEGRLRCQLVEDFPVLQRDREVWDGAVQRLGGPIYMTLDWLEIWWRHYGAGSELRVFIFRDRSDAIQGLLPFYVRRVGWGPFALRVALLVGANLPPKSFDPPIDRASAGEALMHAVDTLLVGGAAVIVSMGPVSQEWAGWPAISEAQFNARERNCCASRTKVGVKTVFRLPATFDEYMEGLAPSERRSRVARMRKLQRDFSVVDHWASLDFHGGELT